MVAAQASNTWGYNNLAFGLNYWISNGPFWQLDLWAANPNPSGTNDYLTDFTLLDFTGYAPVMPGPQAIAPNAGFTAQEYAAPGIRWEQTGPNPPGVINGANGLVLSDGSGFVLAWWQWTIGMLFIIPGSFLELTFFVDANPWDYP